MPSHREPPRRRPCPGLRLTGLLLVAAALAMTGCARRPPPPVASPPPAEAPAPAAPEARVVPAIYDPPPPKLRFNIPAEAQAQAQAPAPAKPQSEPQAKPKPQAKPTPPAAAAFRPATRKPADPKSCRPARPAYDKRGTASFYGRAQHGEATASGEPFDMEALTAAHRTLAFGTRVRVTNLANRRVVVLVINDRGPFVDGRLIDVSRRAARELGFLAEDHLAEVRVEAVTGC